MRVSLLLFSFFLIHSIGAVREPSASYRLGRIALRNIPNYTHINGTEIWLKLDSLEKNAAVAPGPGPAINHAPEFEYLCKVFYCHNENKRYCEPLCSRRALQFDYKSFFDRLDNINSTEPTPNKEACLKELVVELKSSSTAQRLAVSLVLIVAVEYFTPGSLNSIDVASQVRNKPNLRAIDVRIIWNIAKRDTSESITGGRLAYGSDGVNKLDALEEVAVRSPLTPGHGPEYEYLCRLFYCHNENNNNCNQLCTKRTKKVDHKLVDEHIRSINSSQACPTMGFCWKDCADLCLKNSCRDECDKLVQIHFSFENRIEYEQEVKELFKVLNWARANSRQAGGK